MASPLPNIIFKFNQGPMMGWCFMKLIQRGQDMISLNLIPHSPSHPHVDCTLTCDTHVSFRHRKVEHQWKHNFNEVLFIFYHKKQIWLLKVGPCCPQWVGESEVFLYLLWGWFPQISVQCTSKYAIMPLFKN